MEAKTAALSRTFGLLMMPPMHVSYHALRVLREFLINEDPQCGAELIRALEIGPGTLYPMLSRMTKAGWIELAASLAAPNEPTAHFYRLTAAGRAAFLSMLARLAIPTYLWREDEQGKIHGGPAEGPRG